MITMMTMVMMMVIVNMTIMITMIMTTMTRHIYLNKLLIPSDCSSRFTPALILGGSGGFSGK